MAITASMVRELRERTGAAMMDCKKALEAANGSMEEAIDNLRKQGLKSAGKKADRETAEGRIVARIQGDGRRGHLIGVACETDFLAKGDNFVAFVDALGAHAGEHDPADVADLLSQKWKGGDATVEGAVQEAVGQFGENIRITSCVRLACDGGQVGAYVHHDNKQGAIVAVETPADAAKAADVLKGLCQHIVVFRPSYLDRSAVPAEDLEREKAVIAESDEVKKKPAEFRDKIVEGKLTKWYATCTLEEQPWMLDDKKSVAKALEEALGKGTKVVAFERVALG